MKHPVKAVRTAKFWYGPEVEGPFSRPRKLETIFIREKFGGAHDIGKIHRRLPKVEQVYLLEDFRDWDWLDRYWCDLTLGGSIPVVRGVWLKDVPRIARMRNQRFPAMILFARVMGKWVHHLDPKDFVSMGTAFDIWSTKIGRMIRTRPSDYEEDTPT